MIRWKRTHDGFVDSHCGMWRITPLYCGCTRPQAYELRRDNWVIASHCATQHEAKDLAAQLS